MPSFPLFWEDDLALTFVPAHFWTVSLPGFPEDDDTRGSCRIRIRRIADRDRQPPGSVRRGASGSCIVAGQRVASNRTFPFAGDDGPKVAPGSGFSACDSTTPAWESSAGRTRVPKDRSDILETIEAMDFLETTLGVSRFVAAGLCRGARTCFATAVQDRRVSGLALIQIDILVRSRKESAIWLEQGSGAVFQSLARPSRWMRLLRGEADYRSRLATIFASVKRKLGWDGRQNESNQVASALASLSARGVRIHFLFSPGHAGQQYLQTVLKCQNQFRQPLPGMRIEIISQPGHDFHTQAGQRAMLQAVGDSCNRVRDSCP